MKVYNAKSGKRGRPMKMVELDDGTQMQFKVYIKTQKLNKKAEKHTAIPVTDEQTA